MNGIKFLSIPIMAVCVVLAFSNCDELFPDNSSNSSGGSSHFRAVLSTADAFDITDTGAMLGGHIINAGNPPYQSRGVCYSESPNPTITSSCIQIPGSGLGDFFEYISWLQPNTWYYVRSYAINDAGVAYGSDKVFRTLESGSVVTGVVNLTATGVSATQIDLSWTNNTSDATEIYIDRSLNNYNWSTFAVLPPILMTFQDTGLTQGTLYYYRVYTSNGAGFSHYAYTSASTMSGSSGAPSAPSNVVATGVSSSQIDLAWTDNANDETGYRVERSPNNTAWTSIASSLAANSTMYQDTGLSPGTTYYYRVCAFNGNGDSGYAYGSAATSNAPAVLPTLTTSAATGITATGATLGGNITVAGTPAYTERGVCCATTQNPDTANKTAIPGSGTGSFSTTLGGLNPNTTYYVRAYATTAAETVYGNQVSFTTLTAVPAAPANLLATAISSSRIDLAWSGVAGATGYKVERSTSQSTGFTEIASAVTAGTSYQNTTGLSANTAYYYRVRAYNSNGNSSYSATVNATTLKSSYNNPAPVLSGPAGTVSANFTLTWTIGEMLVDNWSYFHLEYSTNNGPFEMLWTSAVGNLTPRSVVLTPSAPDAGKSFRYRIKIVSQYNGDVSPYSNIVTVNVSGSLSAATVNFNPTRVNEVRQIQINSSAANAVNGNPTAFYVGQNFNNTQVGTSIFYDYQEYQAYLYFDLNSQISGRNIKKATLKLYATTLADIKTHNYVVATVGASWNVTTLCWNNKPALYNPVGTSVCPGSTGWWEVDITDIVKSWANNSIANNGVAIYDNNQAPTSANVDFRTRFNNANQNLPVLTVEYQ